MSQDLAEGESDRLENRALLSPCQGQKDPLLVLHKNIHPK